MKLDVQTPHGVPVAVARGEGPLLTDPKTALDLIAAVSYETGCDRVILEKRAVAEAFFDLKTRLAGEILQKFINYRMKLAIVGDFSGYESKSLRDFLYESNQGKDVFFVPTLEDALGRLSRV